MLGMRLLLAAVIVFATLAVPAVGTAIPIVKHVSFLNADDTVRVDALTGHVASVRAKILKGFENYERNTGTSHPAAVENGGTRKRDGGSGVDLKSYNSLGGDVPLLWYTTISIGTPPKSLAVQIDTGASDLFVPSPKCPTCRGHTKWNPIVDSKSAKPMSNRQFFATFADRSSASGYLFTDNVTVAGFTANAQAIGSARAYSPKFQKSKFPPDGMMGMAFESLSAAGEPTLFETLVSEKRLPSDVFSVRLTPTGGELFIGGTNTDLYVGDITYSSVTQEAHWQVEMDGIESGGKMVLGKVDAIIDTGATLIGGDPSQVKKLHEELGGKRLPVPGQNQLVEYYTYPCDTFPRMNLVFGGRSFEILPSALNMGPVRPGSPDCIVGIVGVDLGSTFWSVGGTFLQGVYTVFDYGRSRVGFADVRPQSSSS